MSMASQVLAPVAALAGEKDNSNCTPINAYFGANGQPYCGYTIKYGFKRGGCALIDGCANPAYVPTIRQFMDSKGWRVTSGYQAGDIFVYGSDMHVGFVYEPYSGNTVITLEGNATIWPTLTAAKSSSSGTGSYEGIGYKKRTLDGNFKVYRPPYDGATTTTITTTTTAAGATSNADIKQFQTWLNTGYSAALTVDGSFGRLTRAAACRAMQTILNTEHGAALVVDGAYGNLTAAAVRALDNHALGNGDSGDLVYVLQGLLYCNSNDPGGFDGEFGADTLTAVKAFQSAHGLTVDGEAGADTFKALLSA